MSESMRVFVSYRRQDARHVAGRLADRLVERFQVFMDMDTIEPGTDFTDVIRQAVNDCDVFLSVIGPQWMAVQAEDGQRRLDDPNDWVVAETAAALQRPVPVIPVLVDGATMPSRSDLPAVLASLASRQAMTIHHESFSSDVNRLIGAIERRLSTAVTPSTQPVAAPARAVDPAAVAADYTPALSAFFGHRWAEAVDGFERVLRQQPEHTGARDRLVEARRNLQLSTWNSQADQAAAEGRWSDAVVLLENIRSLDSNYPDLSRRLQAATLKRRVADLQADIRGLAAAGQWAAVAAAGQELAAVDSSRADPDGLVSRAHAVLAQSTVPTVPSGGPGTPGPPGPAQGFAAPPPRRNRTSTWVVSAVALAVAVAVIVGVVVVRGGWRGTAQDQTTSTVAAPDPSGAAGASPTDSTPTVATPPPGPSPTYDTSELRTHIPGDILPNCSDYMPEPGDAVGVKLVGALNCLLTAEDTPDKVWYFKYPDAAAMKGAYGPYIAGEFTTKDCTAKRQKMTFTTTEKGKVLPGGILHCYDSDPKAGPVETYFAWTHDSLHIVSFAADPELSYPKMKAWWEQAGPYREP